MTWKIDRVEEITVSVTEDGQIAIEQSDALGNEGAVIHLPRSQLATLIQHLNSAAVQSGSSRTHKPNTCERCGEREPYGALELVWSKGMAGQDVDAFGVSVCERCAPVFLEQWESIALANTTDEEEPAAEKGPGSVTPLRG